MTIKYADLIHQSFEKNTWIQMVIRNTLIF